MVGDKEKKGGWGGGEKEGSRGDWKRIKQNKNVQNLKEEKSNYNNFSISLS